MKSEQALRLSQITEKTLIVGVDIAKNTHWARCQDFRGVPLSKPFRFDNTKSGIQSLELWIKKIMQGQQFENVLVGMEPTAHYWKNLGYSLKKSGIRVVMVNTSHVHKSKELDDNSPTKNDQKDARVIAQLVKDGRYSEPNMPTGIWAEIRNLYTCRDQMMRKIDRTKKGIQNLLDRYFPEYYSVFRKLNGKASWATLKNFPFPEDIRRLTIEEIVKVWRKTILRGLGKKRAEKLIRAANNSIGITEGLDSARWELDGLMEEWDHYDKRLNELELKLEEYIMETPYGSSLLSVPGIGPVTVGGFLAETGDLKKYQHSRQIQKLAGLNLKENSSGNRRGMTTISKRGRPKLRALLYKASMLLVANNPEFKALHHHFTHRSVRPLKGKQSLTAICIKLIRVLFTLGKKGISYIPEKMLGEFRLNQLSLAA